MPTTWCEFKITGKEERQLPWKVKIILFLKITRAFSVKILQKCNSGALTLWRKNITKSNSGRHLNIVAATPISISGHFRV